MIKAIIFDWGNTVMRDYPEKTGPMAHWDHVEYVPGVENVLKRLSGKYIMCIASNAGCSDTILMKQALKRVGADKYFNYFFTSKDLGFEKPDTKFFLSIINRIHCEPAQCLMIGDSYAKDICGAKAVGMNTVFFDEKMFNDNFPDADMIIHSMNDLLRFF